MTVRTMTIKLTQGAPCYMYLIADTYKWSVWSHFIEEDAMRHRAGGVTCPRNIVYT